jgi:hypothetical protein
MGDRGGGEAVGNKLGMMFARCAMASEKKEA